MILRGDSQSQEAGPNSQQLQIAGDFHIHQGISEERATAIAEATARAVLAEYTVEAATIADERIREFDRRLIQKLGGRDQLPAFRDPSFQVALRKAQLGAASSDRVSDFDMLAGLLSDRAARGGSSRKVKAGIDQAIQVVDALDDAALEGLTMAVAIQQYSPLGSEVSDGLNAMERLLGQLPTAMLPEDDDWVDHLDTLGAVRLTTGIYTLVPLTEMWARAMPGYVTIGFTEEEAHELRVRAASQGALEAAMAYVPHKLKPGYFRLPFVNSGAMRKVFSNVPSIPTEQIDKAVRFAIDDMRIDTPDGGLYPKLTEELDSRPSLHAVRQWWDGLRSSFQITAVGKVLARANAQRHDRLGLLPPLD